MECTSNIIHYTKPDLIVEKVYLKKIDSIDNQKIKIKIEVLIKNISSTDAGPFLTVVEGAFYPPGNLFEIGKKTLNKLSAGESFEFSLEDWFPFSKDIKFLVIVDKENSVSESNEANNQMTEVWKGN